MFTEIVHRIFSFAWGGTKPKVAVDVNNASSPFLFLANLSADQIGIAHRTISSQLIPEKKRDIIMVLIGTGKEIVDDFMEWQVQLPKYIPQDILELIAPEKQAAVFNLVFHDKFSEAANLAYKSSVSAGDAMKKFYKKVSDKKLRLQLAFDNAAVILKQWKERKESEKEATDKMSPLSQRDEEFYDTVETVSAKGHCRSCSVVNATDADERKIANPEPQKTSRGCSPISTSPPGLDSSSSSPPPLYYWDSLENFYVMQPGGKYEISDPTEFFNRGRAQYQQNGVPLESKGSYAHVVSKDSKAVDCHGEIQKEAPSVLSKQPSPENRECPVDRPALFGRSIRSAAAEKQMEDFTNIWNLPSDLTDEEKWRARYNAELTAFDNNPTGIWNSYASVASKPAASSASIALNENKNSSNLLNDEALSSYEKHFHQQLPKENSVFPRSLTSSSENSTSISQGTIRRSMEIENIPGRGDGEDWIADNEKEKEMEKLQSARSTEAVLTTANGPRTRSMTRARQTTTRTVSRSPGPLKTVAPDVTKTSPSPPKPLLPPATAPRQRSESPKFKATRQPKVDALNILLLGETGVGKTTFINGLANYLKFETLDGAMAAEPTILVDASFTITGKNNKPKMIKAKANAGVDHATIELNERLGEKGTSSTQEPVDHFFEWMDGGEKKLVRIVDTPGINDTRGPEQDAKNFDKILKHIAELGELHAVCIVMKPNESKFTVGFRYCLDELLLKLHKSVTKNIVFCFTNTRSTLYRPGDTLSTLHEYLKKVQDETGVCIAANRSNIFCYDNDTFRYLCVWRQLPQVLTETTGHSTKATFSDGWIHNVKEAGMMLKRVQGLTAHVVEDMVSIGKARKVITALARPLGEIARNHVVNMKIIQDKMNEVENLKASGRALDGLLSQEEVVLEHVPLAAPRTVCASPKCVEYVKVNDFEECTDYITICHDPCHLSGVEQNNVMNSALRGCEIFDIMDNCKKCQCSWKNHMHISYELKYKMVTRIDREALSKWEQCSSKKQKEEMVLAELNEKLKQLEREREQIRESCAEFSAFLFTNSLKQSCDPFADYLRHLIDDETSKCENGGGNMDILVAVALMNDDYDLRVKHIKEEIKSGRRCALSTRQLNTKISNLSKLKLCGYIIADLMKEHLEISEKPAAEIAPPKSMEGPPEDLIKEVVSEKNGENTHDKRNKDDEKKEKNTDSKAEEKKNTDNSSCEAKKKKRGETSSRGKKRKNKNGGR